MQLLDDAKKSHPWVVFLAAEKNPLYGIAICREDARSKDAVQQEIAPAFLGVRHVFK
jgi:hypothetical protein